MLSGLTCNFGADYYNSGYNFFFFIDRKAENRWDTGWDRGGVTHDKGPQAGTRTRGRRSKNKASAHGKLYNLFYRRLDGMQKQNGQTKRTKVKRESDVFIVFVCICEFVSISLVELVNCEESPFIINACQGEFLEIHRQVRSFFTSIRLNLSVCGNRIFCFSLVATLWVRLRHKNHSVRVRKQSSWFGLKHLFCLSGSRIEMVPLPVITFPLHLE